jgi:hypothetical protein
MKDGFCWLGRSSPLRSKDEITGAARRAGCREDGGETSEGYYDTKAQEGLNR